MDCYVLSLPFFFIPTSRSMNLGTWAFADFLCLHVFWLLFNRFVYCIVTELSLFNGTRHL